MSSLMADLGLDRWAVTDRLRLIEELSDSLKPEELPPLSEAQTRELERRVAAADADPAAAIPWSDVEAEIRADLDRPR